jgi:hypothetical protein
MLRPQEVAGTLAASVERVVDLPQLCIEAGGVDLASELVDDVRVFMRLNANGLLDVRLLWRRTPSGRPERGSMTV